MSKKGQRVKCTMIAVVVGLMLGVASQAAARPLKVFILAGQSNMQGHANVATFDPKQGCELAGFVWFQGFNDLVDGWSYPKQHQPGGYDEYSQLLAQFIREVRTDLSAPKMPFVIGVMGIDGEKNVKPSMANFRQAMAAPASLPEFQGNVVAVPTAPFWDDDLAALQAREEKKETLTPEESKRLKAGVSNGGYHYLGAAKIMAPIGKAFAEALAEMLKK